MKKNEGKLHTGFADKNLDRKYLITGTQKLLWVFCYTLERNYLHIGKELT